MAGSREHGNDPLSSIKGWEFLDQMSISLSRGIVLHGIMELGLHPLYFKCTRAV
jgi:hypothetical protein